MSIRHHKFLPWFTTRMPLLPAESSAQGAAAKVVTEAQLQVVSFDEFKLGATVRVLKENPPLIYAIDLAMVVTGGDGHDAARDIRRIPNDLFDLGSKTALRSIRFPSGTKNVKFVTYNDALELVMALGGKEANKTKMQFAKILTRYFAGDPSMHSNLMANATSTAPINVLARESLGVDTLQVDQQELDQVVEVSNTIGANMIKQKADAVFLLDAYKQMGEVQKEVEKEKQATFAAEMQVAREKAKIDEESKQRTAKMEEESKQRMAKIDEDTKKKDAERKRKQATLEENMKKKDEERNDREVERKKKLAKLDEEQKDKDMERKKRLAEFEEELKQKDDARKERLAKLQQEANNIQDKELLQKQKVEDEELKQKQKVEEEELKQKQKLEEEELKQKQKLEEERKQKQFLLDAELKDKQAKLEAEMKKKQAALDKEHADKQAKLSAGLKVQSEEEVPMTIEEIAMQGLGWNTFSKMFQQNIIRYTSDRASCASVQCLPQRRGDVLLYGKSSHDAIRKILKLVASWWYPYKLDWPSAS